MQGGQGSVCLSEEALNPIQSVTGVGRIGGVSEGNDHFSLQMCAYYFFPSCRRPSNPSKMHAASRKMESCRKRQGSRRLEVQK